MSALVWLLACSVPAEPPPNEPEPEAAAEVEAPATPSLYELEVPLTRSDGSATTLDVHRGHPVLVSMFYASCHSACPMLVQTVRAFEESLDEPTRDGLRVLLVSLDPARDDPAALREAAERYGADPARWVLAVPPEDRVRELAAVMGIQYRPGADGEIHHTSTLVLLDGEGRPVARSEGPEGSTDGLRASLQELAARPR